MNWLEFTAVAFLLELIALITIPIFRIQKRKRREIQAQKLKAPKKLTTQDDPDYIEAVAELNEYLTSSQPPVKNAKEISE